MRFDVAYSSDLLRCVQTVEIITGCGASSDTPLVLSPSRGLRVRLEPRLREIHTGQWEGLSFDQVREACPDEYAVRERDVVGYRFPDGESFHDLQQRVLAVFAEILASGGESILMVAHKGTNRVLLCHILHRPLSELFSISQGYGSVTRISVSVLPDGRNGLSVPADPDPQ